MVAVASAMSCPLGAQAQPPALDKQIATLQHDWEHIEYRTPESEHEEKFEALAHQAHEVTAQFPQRAEPHVMEGIALAYWAGAKGGMGALGIVTQAKTEFETAVSIDPSALDGSALNHLGVLYYRVPGWPVAFGDTKKAERMFRQALAVNPADIDSNYFYAGYLISRKDYTAAMHYLEQALKAPPRPGREIADAGRRDDIQQLIAQVKAQQ
jgi:tetratricopeptide (TPR) repeat protein